MRHIVFCQGFLYVLYKKSVIAYIINLPNIFIINIKK